MFVESKKYTDEELPLVIIEHPSVIENEEDEEVCTVGVSRDERSGQSEGSVERREAVIQSVLPAFSTC